MCDWFERLLAVYCSPTLAGIKPACLMACGYVVPELEPYKKAFAPRGVCFVPVLTRDGRCLLLVYHRKLLRQRLSEKGVRWALAGFGYPEHGEAYEMLSCLLGRLEGDGEFPHEIGLFLGYPVKDVLGFVSNKGAGCKLCGYWKVYGDVEAARREFLKLSRVCRAVTTKVEQGEPLLKVFSA